jgi:hypothetical protein
MTKRTPSGTQKSVYQAATGAAAGNANPHRGSEGQFERFLAAFGDCGRHKQAAEAAGLTLDVIAAQLDSDPEFAQRYKVARKVRRLLIADALLDEAIGRDVVDPVNGATKRVRNVAVLQRLAVTEGELEPENKAPAVAIQNNVGADPKLVAAQDELRRRLAALGKPKAIEAIDAEIVEPATTPAINDGSDLL